MRPPTLDGHNFLVRAPFGVFLDSMESSWSIKSENMILNVNWFSHPCLKIDCYNNCANYWLRGCEELCAEVNIIWQVVGYLRCMIGHELA